MPGAPVMWARLQAQVISCARDHLLVPAQAKIPRVSCLTRSPPARGMSCS